MTYNPNQLEDLKKAETKRNQEDQFWSFLGSELLHYFFTLNWFN